jgi:hypothetical protein
MSHHYPDGPATGPLPAPPPPPQYPAAQPYGAQPYGAQPYGAQPYGAPDPGYGQYPGYDLQRPRTNVMAILGLIFAFVCSPLGIVFSAIGLRQVKKRREGGRGLAITGLVLSIVFLLIGLLLMLVVLPAVLEAAKGTAATQDAAASQAAQAPAADTTGTVAACTVIVPALLKLEADVAQATTADEYLQVLSHLQATIEAAAKAQQDPVFLQDVQTLSRDFQQAVDATNNGGDTTALESALTTDGGTVGNDCDAAGYAQ